MWIRWYLYFCIATYWLHTSVKCFLSLDNLLVSFFWKSKFTPCGVWNNEITFINFYFANLQLVRCQFEKSFTYCSCTNYDMKNSRNVIESFSLRNHLCSFFISLPIDNSQKSLIISTEKNFHLVWQMVKNGIVWCIIHSTCPLTFQRLILHSFQWRLISIIIWYVCRHLSRQDRWNLKKDIKQIRPLLH